jgi:hypothetical protein
VAVSLPRLLSTDARVFFFCVIQRGVFLFSAVSCISLFIVTCDVRNSENSGRLGCDAVSVGEWRPTFRCIVVILQPKKFV